MRSRLFSPSSLNVLLLSIRGGTKFLSSHKILSSWVSHCHPNKNGAMPAPYPILPLPMVFSECASSCRFKVRLSQFDQAWQENYEPFFFFSYYFYRLTPKPTPFQTYLYNITYNFQFPETS
jgi:hypothetical protein